MATAIRLPAQGQSGSESSLNDLTQWSSKGALWSMITGLDFALRSLKDAPNSPMGFPRVHQLRERLELAKHCLITDCRKLRFQEDPPSWQLLHGIAADMLLLLPRDMLHSEGLEVEANFRRNIQEHTTRETWLGHDEKSGPLCLAMQRLARLARKEVLTNHEERELIHVRYILRSAIRVVNTQSDKYFQLLSLNAQLRGLSGALLLVITLLAYLLKLPREFSQLIHPSGTAETSFPGMAILALNLLGATGAIVANLLSEKPVHSGAGPKWRQFAYHLFIRPYIGAFAAFLFYLLAQSQILFSIGTSSTTSQAPMHVTLDSDLAVVCAYVAFFIAAGFSAEKFLGSAMDRVLNGLFTMADKSQASPGAPADTQEPLGVKRTSAAT